MALLKQLGGSLGSVFIYTFPFDPSFTREAPGEMPRVGLEKAQFLHRTVQNCCEKVT